ncbi:MAG TPA: toll/interleukin-1 receptor domain-containing protein [Acidimicrobiia bacterium]|nr:toll/interleukin-1 receptor domain-containing protein [Acidimicrobiia bacterium]
MRLVDSISVLDGPIERSIALYDGDLAALPAEHKVDYLIVSAFPNNYEPTSGSVIGALHRAGLSVGDLATRKEHDLRDNCGFWMSAPLTDAPLLNISRLVVFEPEVLGSPPEVVGDLFRGLFPFLDAAHNSTIAMPLISAGEANWPPDAIVPPLLYAAVHWLARGLPVRELKIVTTPGPDLESATRLFGSFKAHYQGSADHTPTNGDDQSFDVFMSYSSRDGRSAAISIREVLDASGFIRTFDYTDTIDTGASWQEEIDKAIQSCRHVVAVLSPGYFDSPECKEELMVARLRHKRSDASVLLPLYWMSLEGDLALWLQALTYQDCREQNLDNVKAAALDLVARML